MRLRIPLAAASFSLLALVVSGAGAGQVTSTARVARTPVLNVHWVAERASSTHPPDSALAVGPSDLIDGSNAGVWRYTKAGRLEGSSQTLSQFFSSAGIPSAYIPGKCCVDVRAMWDGALQRFWFTAMGGTCSSCTDVLTGHKGTSYVFVALSDTASAAGGWHALALDETINSNHAHEPYWCDFDQLGMNALTIFLSCDMFPFAASEDSPDEATSGVFSRVRMISKSEFTDRRCGAEPCSWWDLEHPTDANGQLSFAIAPARMTDTGTGYEYMLDAERGTASSLTVRKISDVDLCCDGNPSTRPTVTKFFVSVRPFQQPPTASQKGSGTKLDVGDAKIHSVFYYNGYLYGVQTVRCPRTSLSCVRVYAFDVRGPTPILVRSRPNWVVGSKSVSDYYPALAPSTSGRMTLVFGQSGPAEYPRVDFAGVSPPTSGGCPCFEGQGVLVAGSSPYTHLAAIHPRATLGDYFTAAIDPDFRHVWIRGNLGPTKPGTDWTSVIGETQP